MGYIMMVLVFIALCYTDLQRVNDVKSNKEFQLGDTLYKCRPVKELKWIDKQLR